MKGVCQMSFSKTVDRIEDQGLKVDHAVAVLVEVMSYFERIIEPNTAEAYQLVNQVGHISTLLSVTNDLLIRVPSEIGESIIELLALRKRLEEVGINEKP